MGAGSSIFLSAWGEETSTQHPSPEQDGAGQGLTLSLQVLLAQSLRKVEKCLRNWGAKRRLQESVGARGAENRWGILQGSQGAVRYVVQYKTHIGRPR